LAVLVDDGLESYNQTQSLFIAYETDIKLFASTKIIGIDLLYAAVTNAGGLNCYKKESPWG
jgi:hypothetical protein